MLQPTTRFFIAALIVVGIAANAPAAPITVSAGETATFSFVLPSGAIPILLLSHMTDMSGFDAEGSWTLFTDLNGTGTAVSVVNEPTVATIGFPTNPSLTDGNFSFVLAVTKGFVTINPDAAALIPNPSGPPTTIFVSPQSAAASEPASLALLGLGMAGMGMRRWWRR